MNLSRVPQVSLLLTIVDGRCGWVVGGVGFTLMTHQPDLERVTLITHRPDLERACVHAGRQLGGMQLQLLWHIRDTFPAAMYSTAWHRLGMVQQVCVSVGGSVCYCYRCA